MEQAIDTAFSGWTDTPRVLSFEQHHILLNECLIPRFRVFRPIGRDIETAVEQLLELTEHQAKVFEGLYVQDRVLIEGVAGSGKTFLALQRALSFARCGKRTLFVCYNKELASWIRRLVKEDPFTEDFKDLIKISNFHALASELTTSAGIQFEPSDGGLPNQAFWENEVPDLLEQAILSLEFKSLNVRYDALVVDEAQDFSLEWWYALTTSILKSSDAPIYAFIDPNQSLRHEVQVPPVSFDARFQLKMNCRNTRKIASASASVLDLESNIFPKAPSGIQPRLLRASSRQQQKGLVLEELRRLLQKEDIKPDQIVLIGPSTKTKGSLSDANEVVGIPLVTDVKNWRDGNGVLVTTARSFKGLEADVIILYDLGGFGKLFSIKDLYVACTRAKALLIGVVHGTECREVIKTALIASEAEE